MGRVAGFFFSCVPQSLPRKTVSSHGVGVRVSVADRIFLKQNHVGNVADSVWIMGLEFELWTLLMSRWWWRCRLDLLTGGRFRFNLLVLVVPWFTRVGRWYAGAGGWWITKPGNTGFFPLATWNEKRCVYYLISDWSGCAAIFTSEILEDFWLLTRGKEAAGLNARGSAGLTFRCWSSCRLCWRNERHWIQETRTVHASPVKSYQE